MRVQITLLILVGVINSISAQIGNDKDLIVKNKVKESFEKHCFSGSNSSCTAIWKKYDRKGNSIEWNMGRLGTIYRNIYDKNNNKIFTLWIDKIDTTKIDSIPYVYDGNNQLIQDSEETFKNFYNSKEQLIKQLSKSQNNEENIVRKTKMIDWTSFGKVKTEIIKTEIIETSKQTEYEKLKTYCKAYEYDNNNNLSKEIHYRDDVVTNTIVYNYDSSNRLTEKREKNISRIESINRMKFGNRSDITELATKISYNKNGSIKEKYTYFSDPCMSLNNHYLYKHFYLDNGLLERADVYEESRLVFTISYEYEYFE
ncbi:hypothetical protein Q4Q39_01970 [Flavivirga amylovorans]|uniref:RHS repeat protein n=1 Tax=Flavivirga amylovorans TaxID=870486 RepID=A0ABT8WWW1_9FLAO|nr:hypothetical protein [Flavivirga amylovorans]MDO5986158.1 hypothetical protein [Flavivirga amylovorans]